jgi:hypothetical protein
MVCHQGGPRGALDHWWPPSGAARPEDMLCGVSYRHGGGWWDGPRDTAGFIVQQPGSLGFAGTGLRRGDAFGQDSWPPLVGYECDGAPLDAFDARYGAVSSRPGPTKAARRTSYQLLAAAYRSELPPREGYWQELPPRERDKCWPPRCFAAVADEIAAEFGLDVVLTGSAAETDLAEQVAADMRHPVINTVGPLSIGAMAALMRGARLLVCNDTGVSHIAAGLELPSVVIFSKADMRRWAPLNRRLHRCLRDPAGEHAELALAHARALLRSRLPLSLPRR